jgi:putative MATE family efflux protein|tara:strand:+ start:412 stop:1755 length:1344 start_codon:yes stop_codon:yes gene_type:complete
LNNKLLTSGSITKHVRDLALPSSIGLFFQTMYNVIDSFYAGQISTTALAAMGLSFPVFLLIIATSGGLSRGASALIANAIGSREEDKQRRYIAQSLSMGLVVSLALTVTGILAAKPLFQLLGATGEYLTIALSYMNPIFLGSIFFLISNLSNAILIASGDSKTFSKVLVVGFFLNLILDPWFLYGGFGLPAMGIAGIAWATVVIQIAGSTFMLATVLRRGLLKLKPWQDLLPDLRVYWEIAQQALPATFNIMSVALGFFVITYFLKFYGEPTVAAFGVTTRVEQIGLLPTFGLYAAIMALVGQNNGARNFERIRETMRVCNRLGLAIVTMTSLLIFVFASHLMRIFTSDIEVIDIGVGYIRIMALIQWSYVMTSTRLAMMQAIKRPLYGFFESVLRKVLLPLPLLWLFVLKFEFDVEWVWYSVAAANVLMTLITLVVAQSMLKRIGD